jgi:hypothetical protein
MKNILYKKLNADKIRMNWNKNPIKMEEFKSFLKCTTTKSTNHLGHDNGWTLYENEELKLHIHGGKVSGIDYLDYIEFGKNLANPYNNWVNPFYLSEILTEEGIKFFRNYYKEDIELLIEKYKTEIEIIEFNLKEKTDEFNQVLNELKTIKFDPILEF